MLALAAGVWGLALGLIPLNDNSFLSHVATGRLILESGIPGSDPFSFTANGEPWVVQSWLASLAYGVLDQLWGPGGLLALKAVLVVTLSLLVVRLSRPAHEVIGRSVVIAIALSVGSGVWTERPLLFGLVFLGSLLVLVHGDLDPRWAAPIMWLWANTHGSFPLGLVALACLAAGTRLDRAPAERELRVLRWAVAGTLLAAVNPLGPKLLVFPLHMLNRTEQLRSIIEWQAPGFVDWWQRLFLLQVLLAIVLLVRKPSWRAALPLVVFVAAALLAMRNIPVASLVLLPAMATGLRGLGTIGSDRRSPVTSLAAAALAALAVLLAVAATGRPAVELAAYPVEELAWLEDQGLLGADSRVVVEDYVGNLRSLRDGADARVFIDDRFDMYPADVVEDFLTLRRGRPGWAEVLERREATAVLWDAELPLASLLEVSPDWRIVQRSDDWIVALPR